ncbi:hypothetical protein [Ottowia sp.]|uniref:hypothetical protein n=1 Tax=Ottowia sp. TaxID=1898956 RepID=UPI0025E367A8|nr:hypothetical protein [Ottowia sp.]MBK6616799.1 hypothetical protein [Ottowia sp.]
MTGWPATTPFNGNALSKAAVTLTGSHRRRHHKAPAGPDKPRGKSRNQGVGNGPGGCGPGNSSQGGVSPFGSNDEAGGVPGNPGRKEGGTK